MRHEMHLDVVEPDALVLVARSHEAAVIGLVGELDIKAPSTLASV
jgi:hypothetical protein